MKICLCKWEYLYVGNKNKKEKWEHVYKNVQMGHFHEILKEVNKLYSTLSTLYIFQNNSELQVHNSVLNFPKSYWWMSDHKLHTHFIYEARKSGTTRTASEPKHKRIIFWAPLRLNKVVE